VERGSRRKKESAGLLLYRIVAGTPEVLLVHPGGPFWAGKDEGAWSIPKGEFDAGESPLQAARREFHEETGIVPPEGEPLALAPVRQPSGKRVQAWAVQGDLDPAAVRSNEFTLEWPPRSGKLRSFPEVDRAAWFPLAAARGKIQKGQAALLDELQAKLG
jgi:predicted NUDIX family NTP pyrophosphohydrolase